MGSSSSSTPRTAPHLAATILVAVAVIAGFYLMGFHFVVAGSVG